MSGQAQFEVVGPNAVMSEEGVIMQAIQVYRGDNKTLRFTITQAAAAYDLTDCGVVFSAAKTAGSSVLLQKKNTEAGGGPTEILVNTPTNGIADVYMLDTDTAALTAGLYVWDLVVQTPDLKEFTAASGNMTITPRVTPPIP
jgi:hypothetical protein